ILTQEQDLEKASQSLSKILGDVDSNLFQKFLKKPYKLVRISDNKYIIYIPKWVPNFQVGWLIDDTDDTFYTYEVNQYSAWLGDIPEELLSKLEIGKNSIDATVENNIVKFPESSRPKAEELFKGHVLSWEFDQARIKSGHEFDIILKIIRNGKIPYKRMPVKDEDRRKPEVDFDLYGYQKEATKLFFETGAIGVFHPTGAGKSFVAMFSADSVKGPKILVTTRTLVDQWYYYFEKYAPRLKDEVELVTYELLRARPEYFQKQYTLGIFDECHKLPATSFAKMALLNMKYRIGLSASPHREDGNEDLIFALTGYPIGINWPSYMATTGRKYHPIFVHIVKQDYRKVTILNKLIDRTKKTIIFCDSIALGHRISQNLQVPFIHGGTPGDRVQIVRENQVVVASRVIDLGISDKELQRIIEVDFLFGSRQQEIQRTGRLMHSEASNKRHDIIMTEKEYADYGKRIWVLQEKGFQIKILES
ncbi:MAG TPA: DEAD/DEAH box helicase family protein, partial [Anaerovoracaceae bacterium]|nr:DEAD/DEAH box helicase family protein [Anaerovoracaceae bacterium]